MASSSKVNCAGRSHHTLASKSREHIDNERHSAKTMAKWNSAVRHAHETERTNFGLQFLTMPQHSQSAVPALSISPHISENQARL